MKCFGERGTEAVDLREHVGHVDHVAHRESSGRPCACPGRSDQAEERRRRVLVPPAAERCRTSSRGIDWLRSSVARISSSRHTMQSLSVASISCSRCSRWCTTSMLSTRQMNRSGLQLLHLVEIERAEEPVPPAEGGVRVHEHVLVAALWAMTSLNAARRSELSRERGRSRMRPGARRALAVHHVADVVHLDRLALLARRTGDRPRGRASLSIPIWPVTMARMGLP
jgi:hypothetical protein